mmetsp:Transcript_56642/g.132355  ORF Transcript_56642/g.132355 Transcript_56642/m.132355 type:complete len:205 (+) Transcript_56642:2015-2629(+)
MMAQLVLRGGEPEPAVLSLVLRPHLLRAMMAIVDRLAAAWHQTTSTLLIRKRRVLRPGICSGAVVRTTLLMVHRRQHRGRSVRAAKATVPAAPLASRGELAPGVSRSQILAIVGACCRIHLPFTAPSDFLCAEETRMVATVRIIRLAVQHQVQAPSARMVGPLCTDPAVVMINVEGVWPLSRSTNLLCSVITEDTRRSRDALDL